MIIKTIAIVSLCLASLQVSKAAPQQPQVPKKHLVCYYDSASFVKEGEFAEIEVFNSILHFSMLCNLRWKLLIRKDENEIENKRPGLSTNTWNSVFVVYLLFKSNVREIRWREINRKP